MEVPQVRMYRKVSKGRVIWLLNKGVKDWMQIFSIFSSMPLNYTQRNVMESCYPERIEKDGPFLKSL